MVAVSRASVGTNFREKVKSLISEKNFQMLSVQAVKRNRTLPPRIAPIAAKGTQSMKKISSGRRTHTRELLLEHLLLPPIDLPI